MKYSDQDLLDYENQIYEWYKEMEKYNQQKLNEMKDLSNGKAMKFVMELYGSDEIWDNDTINEKPVKIVEVLKYFDGNYIEARVIRKDGKEAIFVGEVSVSRGNQESPPEWEPSFYYKDER